MTMVIDLRVLQILWIFPFLLRLLTFRKENSKETLWADSAPEKVHNMILIENITILSFAFIGSLISIIGVLNYFSIVNIAITENWGIEFECLMIIFLIMSISEYCFFHLNKRYVSKEKLNSSKTRS